MMQSVENEMMLREGCPSEIWSDRGGAFMSEVVGVVSKVVLDQSGSTLQDIILSAMD